MAASVSSTAATSSSQAGNPADACSIAAASTASRESRPHRRVRVGPGADGTRDGDRERAAERDAVQAGCPEPVRVDAGRRPAGPVERNLLAGGLVPDQPEGVAADPASVRHHHAQDRIGRDRGIHRVASRCEDGKACRRRQVVRRDDGAAGPPHEARRPEGGLRPGPLGHRGAPAPGHGRRPAPGSHRPDPAVAAGRAAVADHGARTGRGGGEARWRRPAARATRRRCRRAQRTGPPRRRRCCPGSAPGPGTPSTGP